MKYRNLPFLFNNILRKFYFYLGVLNYVRAKWWGIKIGKNVKFDGRCHFEKHPNSQINIGDFCKFRSRTNSNLIGINRPCSISTIIDYAIIEIGTGCGFSGTVIGAFKSIKLGNNIKCGANTLITDSDWHLEDNRSGAPVEVIIHDNVWLGEGVKVLKGVEIGCNSVIGAGSVVTKNIPSNCIAAGNPCKVIKFIN